MFACDAQGEMEEAAVLEPIDLIVGQTRIEASIDEVSWLASALHREDQSFAALAAAVVIEYLLDGGRTTPLNQSETEAILVTLERSSPPSRALEELRDVMREQFALADDLGTDGLGWTRPEINPS